jgi:hypothetical protein
VRVRLGRFHPSYEDLSLGTPVSTPATKTCRWGPRFGVAERLVVPMKPGNSGGGKGPLLKTNATRNEGKEIGS